MSTSPYISSGVSGSPVSANRVPNYGATFIGDGNAPVCQVLAAPTSLTATTAAQTLTVDELISSVILSTGGAKTVTTPTGALLDAALPGAPTGMSLLFSVCNLATSGAVTIAGGTGITTTSVPSLAVAASTSASFYLRKTGQNTYDLFRLA